MQEMCRGFMRLTLEQRVAALERENIVLQDTVKLLHRMLKEQRQLINDYITHSVASGNNGDQPGDNGRDEDVLYTFTCKRRFDNIEKRMENLRNKHNNERKGEKNGKKKTSKNKKKYAGIVYPTNYLTLISDLYSVIYIIRNYYRDNACSGKGQTGRFL